MKEAGRLPYERTIVGNDRLDAIERRGDSIPGTILAINEMSNNGMLRPRSISAPPTSSYGGIVKNIHMKEASGLPYERTIVGFWEFPAEWPVPLKDGAMLETLLVFTLGITPPLLSIWLMRKAEARAQARLRRAANSPALRLLGSYRQPEAIATFIGDRTCLFNARSVYIRCAVNPEGPCEKCPHYEAEDTKNDI